jgi:hypothetical protein
LTDDAVNASDLCPEQVRQHTGFPAVPNGEVPSYLVATYFVPTKASWAAGQRWLRCDISYITDTGTDQVAPITTTLENVWNTPQLPSLLVCVSADQTQVTCAEPHVGEILEQRKDAGSTGAADEPYPGADAILQRNASWCAATIKAVTGADVTDPASPFVDLMQAPTEENWKDPQIKDREVLCGVQYRDDHVVTGTLRRPGTA